jgi:hypothetical protein
MGIQNGAFAVPLFDRRFLALRHRRFAPVPEQGEQMLL